mgnify:CR=1 FL=1
MPLALDTSAITHGIQLAVAPVFLLTAGAGVLGLWKNGLGAIPIRQNRQCRNC